MPAKNNGASISEIIEMAVDFVFNKTSAADASKKYGYTQSQITGYRKNPLWKKYVSEIESILIEQELEKHIGEAGGESDEKPINT